MKNLMRNLTLSAAALAALVSLAPNAAADDGGRGRRNERNSRYERHESREHSSRGPGRHAYAPPARSFYGNRYVAPFRVHAGSRFYSYRPGPGFFYVNALGWAFPPFPGAVWVPAHYDFRGFFIEGGWR